MRVRTLAAWIWLAACGGGGGGGTDIDSTISFADRSDAEITRFISAAGGTDMFGAQAQIDGFSDPFEPDPCPAIAVSGNIVTLTGGCTTRDGAMIEGDAAVTNAIAWDQIEYQFGQDTVYELHGFAITRQGLRQRWDGSVSIEDSFTTWDADITTELLGVTMRSDLHYHCTSRSSCSLSGSGLELPGIGGARVSGGVELDGETVRASYTLKGADTLTATIVRGCISWSISGTDRGMTCPQ